MSENTVGTDTKKVIDRKIMNNHVSKKVYLLIIFVILLAIGGIVAYKGDYYNTYIKKDPNKIYETSRGTSTLNEEDTIKAQQQIIKDNPALVPKQPEKIENYDGNIPE